MYERMEAVKGSEDSYIDRYYPFGWRFDHEYTRRFGRTNVTYVALVRDKDMPLYDDIVKLEREYQEILQTKKDTNEFSFLLFIILSLFFVIPGIVYLGYFLSERASIREANKRKDLRMSELKQLSLRCLEKSEKLANERDALDNNEDIITRMIKAQGFKDIH
jgi:hypothetical protein